MTPAASRRRLRRRSAWAVPVVVAVAVVGTSLVAGSPASATAHPVLPPLTAAELLVGVQTSSTQALFGTVVETARLGLPSLPGPDSSAALDWQSLVTGSHTARVWVDGPDRQRLALLGQLAESDVVRSGRDVWSYASADQAVTHAVLPEAPAEPAGPGVTPDAQSLTPAAAAAKALSAIDPTTVVTVDPTTMVADRPAYSLVLTPKDGRSTVRKVAIAVDSEKKVPLRVQVFGAAPEAAFESGFTDITFARPADSVFRFTPPQGSTVTTKQISPPAAAAKPARPADTAAPTVVGTGWTSVLVLPAGSVPAAGSAGTPRGSTGDLIGRLSTTLPSGDRLVRTALVNVLLAKDGRILVGAVGADLLTAAAG